jgi:hypothetical protein
MANMRTIQPPHASERFSLAEARRAWRNVESVNVRESKARAPARRLPPVRLARADVVKVAAERAHGGPPDPASEPRW